jgi:UDP-N-acetylglucosamine--N-acetylmuramyl-(pentapeptide) pyrophosphoryl-undecaprenol N-acetylglucosamine transferase
MKILFTGGGTAGHIFPIIAVAREIRRMGYEDKLFYIGPKDEFSSVLLSQEDIKVKIVLAGKIRRYWDIRCILENILDVFIKIPLGFLQSFFFVFFNSPDLIFSKGGYGSFAPVLSAWLLRIPVILHESDVVPGLANRFLARFASQILVSFPVAQTEYFAAKDIISVGNPIRRELLKGDKEEAKKLFNLTGEKPILLILGGSQGAQKINDFVLESLINILPDFEIIHQTGEKNYESVRSEAKVVMNQEMGKYYHPVPFLGEIQLREAYNVADLIVSRAGSGGIFEITACGKPSILIPFPYAAQDHQAKNAYALADSGGTLVMEEGNLTPRFFLEKVKYLFSHPDELERMAQNARAFSKPESAKEVAQYIINSCKEK